MGRICIPARGDPTDRGVGSVMLLVGGGCWGYQSLRAVQDVDCRAINIGVFPGKLYVVFRRIMS